MYRWDNLTVRQSIDGTPRTYPFQIRRVTHAGRRAASPPAPIWVQGSLRGEYILKSINLRSWEAASELIRGWEPRERSVSSSRMYSVPEAVRKFFADATYRQLSKSTISKQRNVLEKRLLSWCRKAFVC